MRLALELTPYPIMGNEIPVVLEVHHYPNGRIALELMSEMEEAEGMYEPFATATVNMVDEDCAPEEIWVKGWSENEEMEEWLKQNGLIEPCPLDNTQTGFVQVQKYRMTTKLMEAIAQALVNSGVRSRR